MQCPHCNLENAVFQALDPITYIPTIDNWKFGNPPANEIEAREFFCISCEERVKITCRHRHIEKIESAPIWSPAVDKILATCKEKRDEVLPDHVFIFLKKNNFKRIYRNSTCDKVLTLLIEQKP